MPNIKNKIKIVLAHKFSRVVFLSTSLFIIFFFAIPEFFSNGMIYDSSVPKEETAVKKNTSTIPPLDKVAYTQKLIELANNPPPPLPTTKIVKDPVTGEESTVTTPAPPQKLNLWPKESVFPKDGAILPFNRIIAYYGNLYSTKMGVLGQYAEEVMLGKLASEVKKWEIADPETPVIPALHYIATTAQIDPGQSGKYRLRMPGSEIDKVLKMAEKIDAIVFLDVQVGFSTLQEELPPLEKYLKMPNVHLGIDPEFSMKSGIRPGKIVGTYDAVDINFAANYLAGLVQEHNLPPKVLVVHRYTQKMMTNYQNIKPLPEVQIVIHMDGWGGAAKKKNTYREFVYKEPVQFAGFKVFYKHDILDPGTVLMTPEELLQLRPKPVYIQYQ